MAYARDVYAGTGAQTDFDLTFPYIDQDHVLVLVDGTPTSISSWVNSTRVRLASAPALDAIVVVYRSSSPTVRLVDYTAPSTLTESDLDTDSIQAQYLAQEAFDIVETALYLDPATDTYIANSKRITSVADPVDAQDVVTKAYVDTVLPGYVSSASASAAAAAASEAGVAADAALAVASAAAAAISETNADADATQTALDAIATAADLVSTDADQIAAAASAAAALVSEGLADADRIAAAASAAAALISEGLADADATQTALDAIATAADRVQTGLDAVSAAADAAAAALSAAAATGGSVKVSSDDTADTEFLDEKLAVSNGITKATTNPGADELLTLSGAAFLQKDGSVASTAAQDMAGFAIKDPAVEKASDVAVSTTSTKTIAFSDGGIQKITFSGAVTVTLAASGFPTDLGAGVIIDAVNWGAITAVTIPAGWKFAGGAAPTWTVSGLDRFVLWHDGDNLFTIHMIDQAIATV